MKRQYFQTLMLRFQLLVLLLGLVTSTPTFAAHDGSSGSSMSVDCLGLTVTTHEDSLYFEFADGQSFLISRDDPDGSASELEALHDYIQTGTADGSLGSISSLPPSSSRGSEAPISVRRAVATKTPDDVLSDIALIQPALGKNAFDKTETAAIQALTKEIRALSESRNKVLSRLAKDAKAQGNIPLEQARKGVQKDPAVVWIEFQIKAKKDSLLKIIDPKAKAAGFDLSASTADLQKRLDQILPDPFSRVPPSWQRFPIKRGEPIAKTFWSRSNFEEHFAKHAVEFPGITKVEYSNLARKLAETEEADALSYVSDGNGKFNQRRIYKYDPRTSVMVVITEKDHEVITFFKVFPYSGSLPRGVSRENLDLNMMQFLSKVSGPVQ